MTLVVSVVYCSAVVNEVVMMSAVLSACQCHGHSDECVYDEDVAKNKTSMDIHGEMSGGGVCQNCQHNTAGINCEQCRDGFYRPFNVPLDSPHVCRRTIDLFYIIDVKNINLQTKNIKTCFFSLL